MADVLRIVHVLAAGVWLGGTVALVFAGVPAIRTLEGEARGRTMRELGRRWRPWGWGSMGVLVLTGLVLANEHGALHRETLLHTEFGRLVLFAPDSARASLQKRLVAVAIADELGITLATQSVS